MRFIHTFALAFCLVPSLGSVADETDETAPPNFLFIAIDDLNNFAGVSAEEPGNYLQTIYPDAATRERVTRRLTPNLDRLAATSAPFLRSYCRSPLCGPSRTSLLTGTLPHQTGYFTHDRHFRTYDSLKDVVTLPQHLKANGYFTTGLGKIFHTGSGTVDGPLEKDWADARHSWSQWVNHPLGCRGGNLSRYAPREGSVLQFGPSRLSLQETGDYLAADFAANLLEHGTATTTFGQNGQDASTVTLPSDQPFFLACGLFRPHLPFYAPQIYFDLFPTAQMSGLNRESLDGILADLRDLPSGARRFSDLGGGKMSELMQHALQVDGVDRDREVAAWRELVQAYLACVCFADSCIGRLVDGLERSPQRNNTVVMLWSDHGYHLGSKYHIAKQALWEEANRTVMIIRDPRVAASCDGQPRRQIVSLGDLYPTVCSLAGVKAPPHVVGKDLSPLLFSASADEVRESLLMTYQHGNHALRTPIHHFMRYSDQTTELYDMRVDPQQLANLSGAPTSSLEQSLENDLNEQVRDEVSIQNSAASNVDETDRATNSIRRNSKSEAAEVQ